MKFTQIPFINSAILIISLLMIPHATRACGADLTKNKKLVTNFYQQIFNQHQVAEAAQKYLSEDYKQHNPFVATGRKPFVDFFIPFFEKNPKASVEIKRVIAEDDLVILHVFSKINLEDRGRAVMDIFKVVNHKIVEHWDVAQPIPENSANSNTMF